MTIDEMGKDFEVPHKTLDWTGVCLLRLYPETTSPTTPSVTNSTVHTHVHIRTRPSPERFGGSVRKAKSMLDQGLIPLPGRPVYVRSARVSTERGADVNFKICCQIHQVSSNRPINTRYRPTDQSWPWNHIAKHVMLAAVHYFGRGKAQTEGYLYSLTTLAYLPCPCTCPSISLPDRAPQSSRARTHLPISAGVKVWFKPNLPLIYMFPSVVCPIPIIPTAT